MKKFNKTPLTLAMGTAVISGFVVNAQAESNPFAMNELAGGYMVAEAGSKAPAGACGGNVTDVNGKKITQQNKPASGSTKKAEGSCGEGMCGGMMQDGKMKKGMESTCGAMMKGKEGACGMMGGMGDMKHDQDASQTKAEEGSCGAMMKGGEGSCGGMMKGSEGSCGAMMDESHGK